MLETFQRIPVASSQSFGRVDSGYKRKIAGRTGSTPFCSDKQTSIHKWRERWQRELLVLFGLNNHYDGYWWMADAKPFRPCVRGIEIATANRILALYIYSLLSDKKATSILLLALTGGNFAGVFTLLNSAAKSAASLWNWGTSISRRERINFADASYRDPCISEHTKVFTEKLYLGNEASKLGLDLSQCRVLGFL